MRFVLLSEHRTVTADSLAAGVAVVVEGRVVQGADLLFGMKDSGIF